MGPRPLRVTSPTTFLRYATFDSCERPACDYRPTTHPVIYTSCISWCDVTNGFLRINSSSRGLSLGRLPRELCGITRLSADVTGLLAELGAGCQLQTSGAENITITTYGLHGGHPAPLAVRAAASCHREADGCSRGSTAPPPTEMITLAKPCNNGCLMEYPCSLLDLGECMICDRRALVPVSCKGSCATELVHLELLILVIRIQAVFPYENSRNEPLSSPVTLNLKVNEPNDIHVGGRQQNEEGPATHSDYVMNMSLVITLPTMAKTHSRCPTNHKVSAAILSTNMADRAGSCLGKKDFITSPNSRRHPAVSSPSPGKHSAYRDAAPNCQLHAVSAHLTPGPGLTPRFWLSWPRGALSLLTLYTVLWILVNRKVPGQDEGGGQDAGHDRITSRCHLLFAVSSGYSPQSYLQQNKQACSPCGENRSRRPIEFTAGTDPPPPRSQ
ncbi:hypothetical protein J6590_032372 [Homalodisca vitripennis]|nr:hypothetical protein J6590_032372 [Homalodisca vitripennis]